MLLHVSGKIKKKSNLQIILVVNLFDQLIHKKLHSKQNEPNS